MNALSAILATLCLIELLLILYLLVRLANARLLRAEFEQICDLRDEITALEAANEGLRAFIGEIQGRAV